MIGQSIVIGSRWCMNLPKPPDFAVPLFTRSDSARIKLSTVTGTRSVDSVGFACVDISSPLVRDQILSTSGSFQVFSNNAFCGPYRRKSTSNFSEEPVSIQLDSLPAGAFGPKYKSTEPSAFVCTAGDCDETEQFFALRIK